MWDGEPTLNKKTHNSRLWACPSMQSYSPLVQKTNWIKKTWRAHLVKHIINCVCGGAGKNDDEAINKYLLCVCVHELWRANRSDFTDCWFSSLVISSRDSWVLWIKQSQRKVHFHRSLRSKKQSSHRAMFLLFLIYAHVSLLCLW